MPSFTLYIPGEPKGQPRPRAFKSKFGVRVYDPGTAEGWKSQIALAVKPYIPPKPIEGPIGIEATFYFARPKSHYGAKGLKPSAPAEYLKKPDIDNIFKAVADCLTSIGVWKDDSQVDNVVLAKRWASEGVGTHLQVSWTEVV